MKIKGVNLPSPLTVSQLAWNANGLVIVALIISGLLGSCLPTKGVILISGGEPSLVYTDTDWVSSRSPCLNSIKYAIS